MSTRDLLILNVTLQVFDGLFSLQLFSIGTADANTSIPAAISESSVLWGLLWNKLIACLLLVSVFALRHKTRAFVRRAFMVTASVYTWAALACLWHVLR